MIKTNKIQSIITANNKEFEERFTLPAKTELERDTCDKCQKMIKDGEKNSLGNQVYCSAYHAYERTRELGESFSQDDPPSAREIKDFLHQSQLKLLAGIREMIEGVVAKYPNTVYEGVYKEALSDLLSLLPETSDKEK
jgi:hypothetical protein